MEKDEYMKSQLIGNVGNIGNTGSTPLAVPMESVYQVCLCVYV